MGELVGVQVPADVRVRVARRDGRTVVERRHQPAADLAHPDATLGHPQCVFLNIFVI